MAFIFTVCELKTGNVIVESLPFVINGDLDTGLQQDSGGSLSLPLLDSMGELVDPEWEAHVIPWRSLIVVTTAENRDRIVWAGIPTNRNRNLSPVVGFPCKTIEAYLIERYVPTMGFTGQDQTSVIARALFEVAGDAAGIHLEYDCPPSGVFRDRPYNDDENARVFDRLAELAAVENGFNWAIDTEWADDSRQRVRIIARTGYPYLGNRDPDPAHYFELPMNITDFTFTESGAPTHVRAIGDGEGESKVMSAPVIDTVREAALWPRREVRPSFSGVTEQQTIDKHASALAHGYFTDVGVIELSARDPSPGEDFTRLSDLSRGDTARVKIKTTSTTIDDVLVVVGWSLSGDSTYKPVLAKIGAAT